eukprot:gene4759-5938_t
MSTTPPPPPTSATPKRSSLFAAYSGKLDNNNNNDNNNSQLQIELPTTSTSPPTTWLSNSSYKENKSSNNNIINEKDKDNDETTTKRKRAIDFFVEDDSDNILVENNNNKINTTTKSKSSSSSSSSSKKDKQKELEKENKRKKKLNKFVHDSSSSGSDSESESDDEYKRYKKLKKQLKSKDDNDDDYSHHRKKKKEKNNKKELALKKNYSDSDRSFSGNNRSNDDPFNKNQGYINLQQQQQKEQKDGMNSNKEDGDDSSSYLGKEESVVLKMNAKLNEYVETNPNDVDGWIRLAEYQDQFLQFSRKKSRAKTPLIEKKLSIYRKSLILNPDSDQLTIRFLRLASQLWQPDQVLMLWDKVIQKNTVEFLESKNRTSLINDSIWKEYLDFMLSNFTDFTVLKTRKTMISVIQKLLAKRRTLSPKDPTFFQKVEKVEESILLFLGQWLRFEKQAGFSERAIGLYQALIEFNCFQPLYLATESQQSILLKHFKQFWESELPRIGEKDAVGWSNSNLEEESINLSNEEIDEMLREQELFEKLKSESLIDILPNINESDIIDEDEDGKEEDQVEQEKEDEELENLDSPLQPPPPPTTKTTTSINSKYLEWGKNEIKNEKRDWMPAKLLDETIDSNDTERHVMFTDFRDILFRLVSDETKLELIYQFLEFLGVPNPITLLGQQQSPPRYPYHHNLRRESMNSIDDNDETISLLFQYLNQQQQQNTTTIDETTNILPQQPPPKWIEAFKILNQSQQQMKIKDDKVEFIERVFQLGIQVFKRSKELMISYVLFKSTYSLDDAKSLCKQLLNENRTNLILYDTFATLELKSNKLQDAKKIYQTVLSTTTPTSNINSSSISNTNTLNTEIGYLYRQYCLLEMETVYLAIEKDSTLVKKFKRSHQGSIIQMFTLPIHILCSYIESCIGSGGGGTYKPYNSKSGSVALGSVRVEISIKELPWSRSIWLLPFYFEKFNQLFSPNELMDLLNLIQEKEIRLRSSPLF